MARIILRNCRTLFLAQYEIVFNSILFRRYCCIDYKSEIECENDQPSLVYVSRAHQYTAGKKPAAEQLQELFGLTTASANDIVTRYSSLYLITRTTIANNYSLLKKEGISDDVILSHPDMLAGKNIETKVSTLKRLSYDIKDTAPLLSLKTPSLTTYVKKLLIDHTNLQRVATLFQVSIIQACGFLVLWPFLRYMNITRLESNMKLLTDFGISVDEIKNDFCVLSRSTHVITNRLETAKRLNVCKLNTSVLRSAPEQFENHIRLLSDNTEILGKNSLEEYLSKRLHCSINHSKLILFKHSSLSRKNLKKVNEVIDYLISEGFTIQNIVRRPKILVSSVERIRERLEKWKSQGIKVYNINKLTRCTPTLCACYYNYLLEDSKSEIKEIT